jgi:hypothetical protein
MLLLSDFNKILVFSTGFGKSPPVYNLAKNRPVGSELFHADEDA